jgi:hypothetical protein
MLLNFILLFSVGKCLEHLLKYSKTEVMTSRDNTKSEFSEERNEKLLLQLRSSA